jgi:hypothetical protein
MDVVIVIVSTAELLRRKAARRLAQEADKSENVERDMEEPVMKDWSPVTNRMIHEDP